jgi:hypothetical protein
MGDAQDDDPGAIGHLGERVEHLPYVAGYVGVDPFSDDRHDRVDNNKCDVVFDDLCF